MTEEPWMLISRPASSPPSPQFEGPAASSTRRLQGRGSAAPDACSSREGRAGNERRPRRGPGLPPGAAPAPRIRNPAVVPRADGGPLAARTREGGGAGDRRGREGPPTAAAGRRAHLSQAGPQGGPPQGDATAAIMAPQVSVGTSGPDGFWARGLPWRGPWGVRQPRSASRVPWRGRGACRPARAAASTGGPGAVSGPRSRSRSRSASSPWTRRRAPRRACRLSRRRSPCPGARRGRG